MSVLVCTTSVQSVRQVKQLEEKLNGMADD